MNKHELKERFKQYAIKVAFFVLKLPYSIVNKNYSDQLSRSASSSAANYRAALRAKSSADFLNKFKIVEKELDESLFFFELIEVLNPSFKMKLQNCTQKAMSYYQLSFLLLPPLETNKQ